MFPGRKLQNYVAGLDIGLEAMATVLPQTQLFQWLPINDITNKKRRRDGSLATPD